MKYHYGIFVPYMIFINTLKIDKISINIQRRMNIIFRRRTSSNVLYIRRIFLAISET